MKVGSIIVYFVHYEDLYNGFHNLLKKKKKKSGNYILFLIRRQMYDSSFPIIPEVCMRLSRT